MLVVDLISVKAHEWILIPTVPIYYLAKPQPREPFCVWDLDQEVSEKLPQGIKHVDNGWSWWQTLSKQGLAVKHNITALTKCLL